MGTCTHQQHNTKSSKLLRRRSLKMEVSERDSNRKPTKRRMFGILGLCDCNVDTQTLVEKIIELNNRAVSLYSKGDFNTASSLFQEAASLRQQAQPSSDCGHKSTRNDPSPSSYIYQRMEFDEGMLSYTNAEPVRPGDHPQSVQATLLFNAGQARRKLGDFVGAAECYERALNTFLPKGEGVVVSTKQIRTVHHVIIPILHNVGQLSYRKGNLQEAIAVYTMALEHCRQLNGHDDISVGMTLNCLGVLYYHLSAEESERAMDCFQQALRIQNQVHGADSTDEATTLNNLGRVHVQREEFDDALLYYKRALEIRRQCLGPDNIDYAATGFNTAQCLHNKGKLDEAIHLYEEFLRVALVKFSKNHRDIAVVLSGIAQIHQERKEYEKALRLYNESLAVGRGALGDYHSEVAMLLNRIGNFHFEQENFEEALNAYKEGLRIEKRVLEKTHPNIIVTLSNIGEIYRQRNEFDNAIRLYSEAMELQKSRNGGACAEVASTLNVIGLIYDQKGDSNMALKRLQEALIMRRSVLGDSHLEVSATLTYLGTIFYRKNMISTAMQLFTESLRIRRIE